MSGNKRNLFRITRFLLINLPLVLRFFAKFRGAKKRLLIIKADAIGDYILFRNFLETVKLSPLYNSYQIDLLGNRLWEDIAVKYDREYINEFIFINAEALNEAPLKILKLTWKLFTKNYEAVLQPTYSRTFITDGLAAFSGAKQIIGFEGDTERIQIKYKAKTDRFYTKLLKLPSDIFLEFDRSVFFFENLLKQPLAAKSPSLPFEKKAIGGIVIFPGSSVLKRNWEPAKFLDLSKRILENTAQPIYIAGGLAEMQVARYLSENLPQSRVFNVAGTTSLTALINLIGNASLVISNETSVIHIAAATKTKSVCILGGGHFGRFVPYPSSLNDTQICVYEKIDCFNCNWKCIFASDENSPYPCISSMTVERVWQQTAQLLSAT